MTGSFELLPGPNDRLDPLQKALRWWVSRLTSALPAHERMTAPLADISAPRAADMPERIAIGLPDADAFITSVRLPPGSPDLHRKALSLRLPDITPLPPKDLNVVAMAAAAAPDGTTTYRIAMARHDMIADAERRAWEAGARDVIFHTTSAPDLAIVSPLTKRRRRRNMMMDLALVIGLCASAVAASMAASNAVMRDAIAFSETERALRGAAMAQTDAATNAELSEAVITQGVLERRPGQLLRDLAAINEATPIEARWTEFRWNGRQADIIGSSREAASAISAFSNALQDWSVALTGSIRPGEIDSGQQFQLRLTRRSAPDDS